MPALFGLVDAEQVTEVRQGDKQRSNKEQRRKNNLNNKSRNTERLAVLKEIMYAKTHTNLHRAAARAATNTCTSPDPANTYTHSNRRLIGITWGVL